VTTIVDASPLVAFFDRAERHHEWSKSHLKERAGALLVCEPVLTEAWHLLARFPSAQVTLLDMVADGAVQLTFYLRDNLPDIVKLVRKYRDTPMSLAHACIVRMAELNDGAPVLTLDSDFLIYRRRDRTALDVIHPSIS
jgi:predicted nucleic acid-binding protein